MTDLNIIDSFLATFIAYIDSGFGLLRGDLVSLTSLLITIDVTIAALFWVLDEESQLFGKLIKKVLYVGAFAYILNNFQSLANLIHQSFTQLGLNASGGSIAAGDLLKPGRLAGIGFEAAHPLLEQVADLMGLDTVLANLLTIVVLLIAWLIVLLAFFVLAIQLFITVLEFKLTCLAGFVLVPFAFWNKTAFLAERVLGNVITSGIKIMVLAVIVGIGTGFFARFVGALDGAEPDINQTMTLVLAALTLLGLGIFGPSIASGLVSGAPQLGAGAVLGTVGAAAAAGMLAGGGALAAARLAGGAAGGTSAVQAASSMGSASGGSTGGASVSGGAGPAPVPPFSSPPTSSGGGGRMATAASASKAPEQAQPDWAKKMQREQRLRGHLHAAQTALSAGDQPVASANPDITQKE
ncbi:P-type conjugative transfer protein TrbL [Asticcacaulis excentricus]|uniref:P-type conjugative transfer protein TrbL n=1 Tax=Asticcacaulis excentricus (strain ATCC 15261 / DSM 4724 / KCTC 12464 / NCIMB 9791 / VKM B-1370 / CB 48) TaxID=573065 RepID=E8RUT7_ASTEC|nr:P-type conjugative transfer protein TrbL [Asticcacaulis excentricus]ADU14137.1 P-type conjugative transfer protein TrbL [Asticcacaulis excentricus CB 48]